MCHRNLKWMWVDRKIEQITFQFINSFLNNVHWRVENDNQNDFQLYLSNYIDSL